MTAAAGRWRGSDLRGGRGEPARLVLLLLLVAALSGTAAGTAAAGTAGAGPTTMPDRSAARAAWQWPLQPQPRVVRPFAPGPTPYSPGHYGADLAAAEGQAVLAAGAGRVSYAGLLAGRGVVVVVHGSLRTTYEPVDADVAVGAPVGRGQRLGRVSRGHACPALCLHWGLRRGDSYLDPVLLVRGPVRLLPRDVEGGRTSRSTGRGLVVPVGGAGRGAGGPSSGGAERSSGTTAAGDDGPADAAAGDGTIRLVPVPAAADPGAARPTRGAGATPGPADAAGGTGVRPSPTASSPATAAAGLLAALLVGAALLPRR